jgi:hypothetical protein
MRMIFITGNAPVGEYKIQRKTNKKTSTFFLLRFSFNKTIIPAFNAGNSDAC